MGKAVAVASRTLAQSEPTPELVTFTVTPQHIEAARTRIGGARVLLDTISLSCVCTGDFSPSQTYTGNGDAVLGKARERVRCEGKPLLLVDDAVTINCTGTAVTKSPPNTPATASASVVVTITEPGQANVFASEE